MLTALWDHKVTETLDCLLRFSTLIYSRDEPVSFTVKNAQRSVSETVELDKGLYSGGFRLRRTIGTDLLN
jgi:hypothetical protein